MAASINLPKTQRAIVADDKLDYCIRDDVPLPPLADDCVIIKTEAVGLNPVDTKMVGPFVAAGAVYGVCVLSRRFLAGDRQLTRANRLTARASSWPWARTWPQRAA